MYQVFIYHTRRDYDRFRRDTPSFRVSSLIILSRVLQKLASRYEIDRYGFDTHVTNAIFLYPKKRIKKK